MLLHEIKYLLSKEVSIEWRQKYAFGGIMLYAVSTVFVCFLSFKRIIDVPTWNALFWIIVLFGSVQAVSKSFLNERKERLLYLYSITSPQGMILAKIGYNAILVILVALLSFAFYVLFIGNEVQNLGLFVLNIIIASFGFSAILSLMSAIAAKTNNNLTLMSILSFPILLPLLMLAIRLSKNAIDGLAWSVNLKFVLAILALDVVVVTLSYLLFPYLWRD